MKWTRHVFLVAAALGVLGCGDASRGPVERDAGGFRDATIVDGGARLDAAAPDAGSRDASIASDAGGPSCPVGECDPVERDCTGDAICRLGADGAMCVEAPAEPAAEGEACTAPEDCEPGLTCFRRGDGGVCGQPCCPARGGECSGDRRCTGVGVLVDGTDSGFWQCVGPRACMPLAPDEACEPGEGCYIVSSMGETDCRPAGSGDVGEPCVEQADCAPGLFCAGLTSPTCVRICSLGDAGAGVACPSGEGNCRAYSHSPPGTGLCTVEMAARAR